MKGAGAHLHVVRLQDDAAVVGPIALQRQDQPLERPLGTHVGGKIVAHSVRRNGERPSVRAGAVDLPAELPRVKNVGRSDRMPR